VRSPKDYKVGKGGENGNVGLDRRLLGFARIRKRPGFGTEREKVGEEPARKKDPKQKCGVIKNTGGGF